MMKTLCVAALVLSLSSVCQPAPLACEKLLQPVDKAPDLSGRWYVIAISSSCILQLVARVLLPSVHVEVTSKETPNVFDYLIKLKMHGLCANETFFQENNKLMDEDSNNTADGDPDLLLQTGCSDCIVTKGDSVVDLLVLFSRRTNITAAELKEFETQAECLGLAKPQVLDSDHVCQPASLACEKLLQPVDKAPDNNKLFDVDSNSRRRNITAAELKEFETQAECLGLAKPQVLDSDHAAAIEPSHFDKMKVSLALNVFRKATSAGLKYMVQQENRPLSYLTTAWFLEQVDRWFDLMSSRHPITVLSRFKMEEYQKAIIVLQNIVHLFRGIKI
ncbi:hypothetical protein JOQ06_014791, partial [Pogonophryne albipinna]